MSSFIIFISRSSMSQSIIKAKCSYSNHTSIHGPPESIKSESCERAKCESCGSWFHRETRLRTCFCCVWVRQVWWVLFYETMKHKMSKLQGSWTVSIIFPKDCSTFYKRAFFVAENMWGSDFNCFREDCQVESQDEDYHFHCCLPTFGV